MIEICSLDPSLLNQSKYYIDFINHCGLYKGIETTLKLNKEIRLSVTRYLSGQCYRPLNVQVTYDGIPKRLGGLVKLIRS